MSEFLKNNEERQKQLKEIVKDLHEGSNIAAVRKRFDRLIRDVSAQEIADMEQALISEGIPVEQVQKLCDVHVQVFEKTLEKQKPGKPVPGHPVHSYQQENREAKRILRSLGTLIKKASNGKNREEFEETLKRMKQIEIHYQRKENQLFPFLEQVGFTGPSKVMWGKHDEIRALFKEVEGAYRKGDRDAFRSKGKELIRSVKRMIFMEERILFPTAMRKLPEGAWAQIRKGEPEIGYAWITPGNLWDAEIVTAKSMAERFEEAARKAEAAQGEPAAENAQRAAVDAMPEEIPLDTGILSPEQINLMLKGLTVDITYVDENDEVRYYSQGKDRVFPRSPGIIGRKVQNCHPPKSVHIVEKIVEAFKNKERDEAEFWITMNDKFIHIRYFPLWNEKGEYKGVIEVTQDVSHIRSLEGQKRLLDWE